ncbi:DUF819 family protein [Vulcanococcus sp.]|jgi:uncharacterized membrane protein|uniref:DUF819 family protein n=1 Tax=Vulcanococcus sp. TaxID=2856995 RepID=UPI0037DA6A20
MAMLVSLLLILLITALGWWLAERTAWGRQLGTTMLVLLLGLLVSNLSGLKPQAEAAAWINGPLTSLAIALLLLAVDLRRVWPDARRLLVPFLMAVVCTVLAVLIGGWLLQPLLGPGRSVLAGMFAATFTGGSLNFVSVARALQPPEALLAVATTADYVVFAAWFAVSLALARRQGVRSAGVPASETAAPAERWLTPDGGWWQALLWGLAVLLLSNALTAALQRFWPVLPSILVLTTLTLLAAQLPAASSRRGCYGLGLLLIQPFFTVMGLSSPVGALLGEGLPVLFYAALIVALQGLGLLLLRRWRGWGLGETLVASQASIGGPSTALALATAIGRAELALPAVAIGLLGYLLGTYLGLLAAALLA